MASWKTLKDENRKRLFLENEFEKEFHECHGDEKRIMERIVDCSFNIFFNTAIYGLRGELTDELLNAIKTHDDIFVYSGLIGESYYLFEGLVEYAYKNKIAGKRLFFFRDKEHLNHALSDLFQTYDENDPDDIRLLADREDIRALREVFKNNELFFLDTYGENHSD